MKRVLPAVALLALALPATAAAHANLVRTDPASGSVRAQSPAAVQVVFDDVVRVGPGIKAVRNGGGSVLGSAPTASGRTLVIPLQAHLRNGDYSVRWSIISDDGHLESGVLAFGVGVGRAPPTAVLKAEATGPGAGVTVTRWLFLAGVLAAVGISLYALFVLRRLEGDVAQRVAVVLGVAAVLVAIGAGIEAHRVGLGTRYGAAMGAGFAAAGLVAIGAIVALRPALVLALGLAVVPSVSGHALDPGLSRVNVVIDVLHVLAASAWVGVVLGLVSVGGERRRAGLLAGAGVVVVGITGGLRAGFELTAMSQLWETSYGQTILVKTGIALAALALGWLLRARFRRRAVLELALVAGLVVAVAVLVQLRPGRNYLPVSSPAAALEPTPNPPAPPPGAIVLAREAGPLAIALEAEPHRLTAIVLSPAGGGLSGLHVRFVPSGAAASPCGSGCYRAAVTPSRHVRVEVSGFGSPETASFALPLHAPSATGIVRRYARRYRSLPGVTFEERLTSSPTNAIAARWRLESPDRLAYEIKGSGGGIVIGNRRWDRNSGRGHWLPSTQDPKLPQPATLWERVTNAHVLSVRGDLETVSFADPSLGAFFRVTFDPRTLRPRVVHMAASAHFMTDRYLGFSPARQIRPPR
ncbi:MAG: copper resistance CopC family protein [Gaiellaceae bacterium]